MKTTTTIAAAVLALAAALARAQATRAAAILQPGDRVAICGDSITEQHIYSADMEAYLLLCKPVTGVVTEQFGWSGETAAGFHQKMPWFMLPFGNTVATTCYGMNDGRYAAPSELNEAAYRRSQTAVVRSLKSAGYRAIVLGSPGAVDTFGFRRDPTQSVYNETLARFGDIDRDIAAREGVTFVDLHGLMTDVMVKAKAKYGEQYCLAGTKDGIHPDANGHLLMAYAFLKALGVKGDIGTITFDGASQKATASDGHKVLSVSDGSIHMESTRYPFCFDGDPAAPDSTSGIIQFFPFNEDLNRFRLVVTHPGADRLWVTFGQSGKEFTAAELAAGINLAAEFTYNPFSEPFADQYAKIRNKQGLETEFDKNLDPSIASNEQKYPQARPAYEAMRASLRDVINAQARAVATGVPPVRYTIRVDPLR